MGLKRKQPRPIEEDHVPEEDPIEQSSRQQTRLLSQRQARV
jgi:hypothetical protein